MELDNPILDEQVLSKYADLIVALVAVGKDDFVLINCDFNHGDLVSHIIKKVYQKGAKYAQVLINSDLLDGLRAEYSEGKYLSYFPENIVSLYKDYKEKRACVISIRSPESPEANASVSAEKLALITKSKRTHLSFYHKAVVSDYFSWIVVSFPSLGWAKNVFPDLPAKAGMEKLWKSMQSILRLDQENPLATWKVNQENILFRRSYMNEKKYKTLRFKSSGTDLTVALNERSQWLGAAHLSENGKYFQANLPTEELYTSPDCRFTEGKVTIERPLPILGKKVEGVTITFQKGKVVDAHAKVGNDVLQQFLDAHPRNRYMGEIAMVDINSPIWKSGLIFNNILYDENAGVHFALGTAYTSGYGFRAGNSLDSESLIAMGCNSSPFHVDFTFGNEEMNIFGVRADGQEEKVMERGLFVSELNR